MDRLVWWRQTNPSYQDSSRKASVLVRLKNKWSSVQQGALRMLDVLVQQGALRVLDVRTARSRVQQGALRMLDGSARVVGDLDDYVYIIYELQGRNVYLKPGTLSRPQPT